MGFFPLLPCEGFDWLEIRFDWLGVGLVWLGTGLAVVFIFLDPLESHLKHLRSFSPGFGT
jgi:hypothetical protein